METRGTDEPDEVDGDLEELEALERDIAGLEHELAVIDGGSAEAGEPAGS